MKYQHIWLTKQPAAHSNNQSNIQPVKLYTFLKIEKAPSILSVNNFKDKFEFLTDISGMWKLCTSNSDVRRNSTATNIDYNRPLKEKLG